MDILKHYPTASSNYNPAKFKAKAAIQEMTHAMQQMGTEHTSFHDHFADVKKRFENVKKAYGGKELDIEVVRSTALDRYVSEGNIPKVMALGHFEMEMVLKAYEEAEVRLGNLQKETARRVEALVGDRGCEDGDEQSFEI